MTDYFNTHLDLWKRLVQQEVMIPSGTLTARTFATAYNHAFSTGRLKSSTPQFQRNSADYSFFKAPEYEHCCATVAGITMALVGTAELVGVSQADVFYTKRDGNPSAFNHMVACIISEEGGLLGWGKSNTHCLLHFVTQPGSKAPLVQFSKTGVADTDGYKEYLLMERRLHTSQSYTVLRDNPEAARGTMNELFETFMADWN